MRYRLAFVFAALVTIAGAVFVRAQVDRPGPTYPLWEYRTELLRGPGMQDMSEATLNDMGRQGWELTALTRREIRVQDSMQTETVYVFKRSKMDARR
ncbi:MAG TPA: hypothetical protein VF147_01025 [Vicinamibacterales bacterium]